MMKMSFLGAFFRAKMHLNQTKSRFWMHFVDFKGKINESFSFEQMPIFSAGMDIHLYGQYYRYECYILSKATFKTEKYC